MTFEEGAQAYRELCDELAGLAGTPNSDARGRAFALIVRYVRDVIENSDLANLLEKAVQGEWTETELKSNPSAKSATASIRSSRRSKSAKP